MAKRYKPSVRAICSIGTLAHNRSFTASEIWQYLRYEPAGRGFNTSRFVRWLRKHGHVRTVEGRKLYPTPKGWKMIEKACGRRGR